MSIFWFSIGALIGMVVSSIGQYFLFRWMFKKGWL